MPDQYGRKTLDEAIAAAYAVRYQAEEEARQRGSETDAGVWGWVLGFLIGAGTTSLLWIWCSGR